MKVALAPRPPRRGVRPPRGTRELGTARRSLERIDTGPRYSEMVVHAGVAYLTGQVADDADLDIRGQTRQTLDAIDRLLQRAGSSRARMLSAQVFLPDLADFAAMNEVWEAWVPAGQAPARATVQARLTDPRWRVEIVVTAAV